MSFAGFARAAFPIAALHLVLAVGHALLFPA